MLKSNMHDCQESCNCNIKYRCSTLSSQLTLSVCFLRPVSGVGPVPPAC